MWGKKVSISTVEFALSSHLQSTSACKWPLRGDRPFSRGLSLIRIIFSENITLFWNKHTMGEALLLHNPLSTSISDCVIFSFIVFLKWSQTKWISAYQVLGGRLIDRVDDKGKYNFPFFSTILFHQDFDDWPLNRGRSWLMEVQLHLNIMIRPKPMQWYIASTVLIRLATVETDDREDYISSASLLSGQRVNPCSVNDLLLTVSCNFIKNN